MLPPTQPLNWIQSESEGCSVMYDSLWAQGLYSPWNSAGQNTRVVAFPFSRGIFPTQGLNAGDLHSGSPRTLTWVASLSLLLEIFPTQELNPGFLHCRWILYQLSYQGSSIDSKVIFIYQMLFGIKFVNLI